MKSYLSLALSLVMAASILGLQAPGNAKESRQAANQPSTRPSSFSKVDQMFEAWKMPMSGMNRGKESSLVKFPKELGWGDIPALLRHVDGTTSLTRILVNPLSSQIQRQCSEGVMALWLVEGVRRGGRFASNNPLCVPKHSPGSNWTVPEESTRKVAVRAYQEWWKRVKDLPVWEASKVDPLVQVDLCWL